MYPRMILYSSYLPTGTFQVLGLLTYSTIPGYSRSTFNIDQISHLEKLSNPCFPNLPKRSKYHHNFNFQWQHRDTSFQLNPSSVNIQSCYILSSDTFHIFVKFGIRKYQLETGAEAKVMCSVLMQSSQCVQCSAGRTIPRVAVFI